MYTQKAMKKNNKIFIKFTYELKKKKKKKETKDMLHIGFEEEKK